MRLINAVGIAIALGIFLFLIIFFLATVISYSPQDSDYVRLDSSDCNKMYAGYCDRNCEIGEWEDLVLCKEWLDQS